MPDLPDRLTAALADRYRVEREIGRGGMATVYLATDQKHNRQVAVKVLRTELAQSLGSERFLREIQIAARLNHPHVLPLHDSGEADGYLYYVMPYVQGESLRDRLRRERQLPVDDALAIAREVADAIGHAHSYGIVHRDLKPENILLSEGHAVVADFGIARAMTAAGGEALTETGLAIGTPTYMSPEQAAGANDIDGRTDVYSLGCVLYEMLAGEPPYSGPSAAAIVAKKLSEPPTRVSVLRETVPRHIESAIDVALAKIPADRFSTARQFAEALAAGPLADARPAAPATHRRWRPAIAIGALAVAALATIVILHYRQQEGERALDPDVLAVAPFDVLGPGLEMWREGLPDMLAQQLDGVGTLRTVPPSAVYRAWRGAADPASVMQLGAGVGAALVVYGRLAAFAADSVRATVTLFDVESGTPLARFEHRVEADRIVALMDSLAVHVLGELSRVRSLGAVPLQSLGSSSPQAVVAFLRGEQHYRRYHMDSAAVEYRQAVAFDTGFALAYNRLAIIGEWTASPERPEELWFRAAALNRGLAARESLAITADSLYAATSFTERSPPPLPLFQRLFATLETADLVYPGDVGIRYRIAEARIHRGWAVGVSATETLEAFRRTTELDSAFGPPWVHLIPLTFWLDGVDAGRDAIRTYLRWHPTGDVAEMFSLFGALVDARDDVAELDALLDTARQRDALTYLHGLRDSGEFAVQLARHGPPARIRVGAATALAYRGHLREASRWLGAVANPGPADVGLLSDLALFHVVPRDSVYTVLHDWERLGHRDEIRHAFLAWWAEIGDTASIQTALREWESVSEADTPSGTTQSWSRLLLASGRAWLALARGDTVRAGQLFEAAARHRCYGCYRERLAHARLLAAGRRDGEAAEALRGEPTPVWHLPFRTLPGDVLWALERARVNERLGNTERAIRDYRLVAAVWINADSVLQPFVEESVEALRRLTGGNRRDGRGRDASVAVSTESGTLLTPGGIHHEARAGSEGR